MWWAHLPCTLHTSNLSKLSLNQWQLHKLVTVSCNSIFSYIFWIWNLCTNTSLGKNTTSKGLLCIELMFTGVKILRLSPVWKKIRQWNALLISINIYYISKILQCSEFCMIPNKTAAWLGTSPWQKFTRNRLRASKFCDWHGYVNITYIHIL